jgi:NAD(P)-dependent dehydrogenase (short-subunit alcohol dehydrogenase family)
MAGELSGKSVVVIGGTTGMGLSACRAIVAAGGTLVAVGLDAASSESASRELGDLAGVITADATDSQTAQRAIQQAIDTFGRFDALYHVAGGSGRRAGDGPLHEISDEGWKFTLELNQTSLFYSNRAAVRQFLAQKTAGSILNLSSVLAFSPGPAHFATHAYAAAKAAVMGFTRSCAAYYAPQNIRFNLLAPGLVDTPMARRAAGDASILKYISTKQPLDGGRIGRADDLDAAVVFFLSDASRFVTGQALAIDGGWSVTEGRVEE